MSARAQLAQAEVANRLLREYHSWRAKEQRAAKAGRWLNAAIAQRVAATLLRIKSDCITRRTS